VPSYRPITRNYRSTWSCKFFLDICTSVLYHKITTPSRCSKRAPSNLKRGTPQPPGDASLPIWVTMERERKKFTTLPTTPEGRLLYKELSLRWQMPMYQVLMELGQREMDRIKMDRVTQKRSRQVNDLVKVNPLIKKERNEAHRGHEAPASGRKEEGVGDGKCQVGKGQGWGC
jgi:hypothetical protein